MSLRHHLSRTIIPLHQPYRCSYPQSCNRQRPFSTGGAAFLRRPAPPSPFTLTALPPPARAQLRALAAQLRAPHLDFPLARALAPRELIFHAGPTNSGKTHAALQALGAARSGAYCAPLRLLAWEAYEKLVAGGGGGRGAGHGAGARGVAAGARAGPRAAAAPQGGLHH